MPESIRYTKKMVCDKEKFKVLGVPKKSFASTSSLAITMSFTKLKEPFLSQKSDRMIARGAQFNNPPEHTRGACYCLAIKYYLAVTVDLESYNLFWRKINQGDSKN
jgi:hypothetical protein